MHSHPSSAANAVVFESVSKRFGAESKSFTALDAIDFAVARGSITGIIGRSGAGKSTLIRLVNGLETSDKRQGHRRRRQCSGSG